jgi:hypothetical protein
LAAFSVAVAILSVVAAILSVCAVHLLADRVRRALVTAARAEERDAGKRRG